MSIFKKPQTKLGIWLLCFVLTVVIVTTGTVAWFVMNTEVSISSPSDQNLAVQVNAGDLEVSVAYKALFRDTTDPTKFISRYSDFSPYSEDFRLSAPGTQYIDVTGDGKSLWFPLSLDENDYPIYENPNNWDDVTDVVGYCISLKAKFKTSQTMEVFLSDKSFVRGLEDIFSSALARPSEYSAPGEQQFSLDGIAGAIRVAFLELIPQTDESGNEVVVDGEVQYNEVLKSIWIPNDTYRLVSSGGYAYYYIDGERESDYTYWVKNQLKVMEESTYGVNDYRNKSVMVGNYGLANEKYGLTNASKALLSFTANGKPQEKTLLIRIWFEGTDSEANVALDGGKIKYNLDFVGINKDKATLETETKISEIRLLSGDLVWKDETSCQPTDGIPTVLYSYDCIEWTPYGVNANRGLKPGTYTLYLKSAETKTNQSSEVYSLNVTIEEQAPETTPVTTRKIIDE